MTIEEERKRVKRIFEETVGKPAKGVEFEAFFLGYLTGYSEALKNVMPDIDKLTKPYVE